MTPWLVPATLVGARSGGETGVGRKKAMLLGWLMRGVRLAAAAGEVKGRAGVSGALGRLAGPGATAHAGEEGKCRLGWLAGQAGRADCEASFFSFSALFFFFFI